MQPAPAAQKGKDDRRVLGVGAAGLGFSFLLNITSLTRGQICLDCLTMSFTPFWPKRVFQYPLECTDPSPLTGGTNFGPNVFADQWKF